MKKVCICGTSKTLYEAPFNDDSFEFWILNDMYQIVKGAHRIFDPHSYSQIKGQVARVDNVNHLQTLASLNVPIYMQDHFEDIPTSIKYPLNEVIEYFGTRLFNSTIDYMIALAIYEGFEEIRLYGVEMSIGEEYEYQRPSCLYWLGEAKGRGIKVILPKNNDLLKQYFLYGYESKKKSDFEIKAKAKIQELDMKEKEFQKNYYIAHGARDTWEFILREIQRG